MREYFRKSLTIMITVLACVFTVGIVHGPVNVEAKTVSANRTTNIYCDGRYVYYTKGVCQADIGIMRLDTKTGKKKKIVGSKYKKKATNGIENVTMKGNYLYYTWDHQYGSSVTEPYIYRVQKNGKKAKKLAMGCNPVIVGNRIYYEKYRLVEEYGERDSVGAGWASMKLDGSGKRKETGIKFSWKDNSPSKRSGGGTKKATTGNNYYYTAKNSTVLMRMNLKNGKTYKLYTCGAGETIIDITAHKSAVIIDVQNPGQIKDLKIIYVSQDGKKKVKLRTTNSAG